MASLSKAEIHIIVDDKDNQLTFLEHYLRLKDPARAVVRAGFVTEFGFAAALLGKEFLKQRMVSEALYQLQSVQIMQPNDVLSRLSEIANANIEDFLDNIDEEGNYEVNLRKAQLGHQLGLVKKLKRTRYGVEIELHDKVQALRLLGQHSGLFVTVTRQDTWREAAIRDIRAGTLTYDALMIAFDDREVVNNLFKDAGLPIPAYINAPKQIIDDVETGAADEAEDDDV